MNIFRRDTPKGTIGKLFQLGLKMIHRKTITRADMIVMERSFIRDINIYFLSMKSLEIWFGILKDFTFGTFSKGNVIGWEKFICSKRSGTNNNLCATEIAVSKSKVPFQEEFYDRRQILIFTISDTHIDTRRVNYIIASSICGKMILGVIIHFQHSMASKF